jgi:hypothetical protein
MVAVGLIARNYATGPIHFTGVLGHAVNAVVIVVLLVNPYTAGGSALFYGATMLVAAWRGQRGCESTVISNLILRRDDRLRVLPPGRRGRGPLDGKRPSHAQRGA